MTSHFHDEVPSIPTAHFDQRPYTLVFNSKTFKIGTFIEHWLAEVVMSGCVLCRETQFLLNGMTRSNSTTCSLNETSNADSDDRESR